MKGGNMGSGYRKKVGSGIKPKEINMPTPKMMKKFQQEGTISTIARPSNAKKFVDIRTRINKLGGYRDGGPVRNSGTPSMMEMMTPRERANYKRNKMKEMGLKPGDLEKKPRTTSTTSGKSKLTREQLLQKAKGKNPTGLATSPGVRRDQRKKKRFALGGEAGESVGRATVEKRQREIRRKEVDDMLDRVYGTAKGKPKIQMIKKKPKDPKRIVPKKKPKKP